MSQQSPTTTGPAVVEPIFAPVPAPELLDQDGREMNVRRAWPQRHGQLSIEVLDRTDNTIRSGKIAADGRLTLLDYGSDPALPGLAAEAVDGRVLVHRYKRRAVVLSSDGRCYTKILARNKADNVARISERLGGIALDAGFGSAAIIGSTADRVVFAPVEGTSLYDLGASAGQERQWAAAWQNWQQRWPGFVDRTHMAGDLPEFTSEDEVANLLRWVGHAIDHQALDAPAAELQNIAAGVAAGLVGSPAGPEGVSHRDLHDKHLLYQQPGVVGSGTSTGSTAPSGKGNLALLDFDTASIAETALDLANLKVHLDFRVAQRLLDPGKRRLGVDSITAVAGDLRVPDQRMTAYEASTRLRLACVYAFRPVTRQLANRWLRQLATQMGR
ncbi:phosphotransferase [Arthrobacter sp. H14]|uniref:phosphotransferase n=1 Tax=Arthrobacter sp. H14 TaxID=1312959 RepID=UPI0004797988|nr:phosphotransferase [Arthrobacter sp. H14]